MIENFDLDLTAVGVAGEAQFDAQLRGAVKRIRIVGQENVGHIAANQGLYALEHLHSTPAGRAFALVIDTDEVERRPLKLDFRILLTQQSHSVLREKYLRFFFRASVNFVIAVAAPNAERGAKPAHFINAIGDRVAGACDEVAGCESEVRAQIVGHIDGATDLQARHVTTQMDVADLDDLHALEPGGQIGYRDFYFADLIVEALGGKTVHRGQKRSGTGESGGCLKEVATRGVGDEFRNCWRRSARRGHCRRLCHRASSGNLRRSPIRFKPIGGVEPTPNSIDGPDSFYREVSEERTEEPQTREDGDHIPGRDKVPVPAHAETVRRLDDTQQKYGYVN